MSPHTMISASEHENMTEADNTLSSADITPTKSTLLVPCPEGTLRLSQLSSHSSTSSAPSLPLTPASSIKGHSRFPSSSTLASSPPIRASMDSYLAKRPLAQLREHPAERDSETNEVIVQTSEDPFESFPFISRHVRQISTEEPSIDYDWIDNQPFDESEPTISVAKRRRADKSTPSILSTKIASRFPSFSRKFKARSEKRTSSLTDGLSLHESFRSRSRASSMRSATTRESSIDVPDRREVSIFPTPRTSYIEEEPLADDADQVRDFLEEDDDELEDGPEPDAPIEHPGLSRTPLLPPVLSVRSDVEEQVQSPLQSPKVAGTPITSPPSPYDVPVNCGLPSPPLSSRPSVASFHHRPIVPSSQIPPIALGHANGPVDEWALRLGHENFSIQPEPYLPLVPTFEACRQLKADWEQAERDFGRHLARTRAHYSATSNIAQLTEQKWASINALWLSYHTQAVEAATKAAGRDIAGGEDCASVIKLELSRQGSLREPVPMAQIPHHLVGGKFPTFGDAGIVGPMEVVKPIASAMRAPKSRKRSFWRFLQDLIPGALASKA